MAIVSSKFRVSAASSFAKTFGTDNMYLILGRPQPWNNSASTQFSDQASGTVTDTNPPNPVDNYENEYALWRDAMAAIRLSDSDVKLCTSRHNWSSGSRYDMYRHNVNSSDPTETNKFDLSDSNFVVYVTSTGSVYKCLYNGRNGTNTTGVLSTVMPSTTGTAPQTTADGYIWKYLYSISAADSNFLTANYIPVPANTTSISNVNGLDVILVTSPGASYSSAPLCVIYGDGSGATASVAANTSTGTITGINVTNAGSGYTWAKIVLNGGGTPTTANAIAIIAPQGGHGSNIAAETMAHNVMIAGTVSGYESNDFPVNQDFRTVALVRNPSQYTTSVGYKINNTTSQLTLFSSSTGRILRTLVMTSNATTAPANDLEITGSNSLASGLFVFQSSSTVNLEYIQPIAAEAPSSISDTRIDATTKNVYQFNTSDTITASGGYSALINSSTGIYGRSPEIHPYSGQMLYLDYRQPVTRAAGQNELINIVINF